MKQIGDSEWALINLDAMDTKWDFEKGEKNKFLPDHDVISLDVNCSKDQGIPVGHVRVGLVQAGTWWKGITQHKGN